MSIYIHPLLGDEEILPFIVCGIGSQEEQCPIKRRNGYPLHQLIFSRKGTGLLHTPDRDYVINEGDYFYLKPNESHGYESTCNSWSTDWILFKGHYMDETLIALGFDRSESYTYKNNPKISTHFTEMVLNLQSNKPGKGYLASSQLYEMLIMLQQNKLLSDQSHTNTEAHIMNPVIAYIDDHYQTDISLDELAREVAITPQHLCKVFKDTLHMRPFEYIIKRSLMAAKKLLLATTLPIKTISQSVGYADNSYFGVLFKRHEGITASEYRGARNSSDSTIQSKNLK
jgi:AraC family transcriptional regulator of arabinose operon